MEKETEEKSKRGRKKKENVPIEPKLKKKRGRKAALKYFSSSIRKQMPLKSNITDTDNDILHLNIIEDNIENNHDILDKIDGIDENETDQFHEFHDENSENDNDKIETEYILNEKQKDNHYDGYYDHHQENLKQESNIKKGFYQNIPVFTEKWCDKTNIKCWWCIHTFDTLPLGCPVDYNRQLKKFRVEGIFCSFSCIQAYMRTQPDYTDKLYLLKYMYKALTGSLKNNFTPAPSRYVLTDFGGHLSIDNFRKLSYENKTYQMIEYPMFLSRNYVAEIDLLHLKKENENVFTSTKNTVQLLDIKRVEDAKIRISKKNNNSTPNQTFNTIEAFLKN